MSDWEWAHIKNRIEHLEKRVESHREQTQKESITRFIWLMVISNILFWFCVAHYDLNRDFYKLVNKQQYELTKSHSAHYTDHNKT